MAAASILVVEDEQIVSLDIESQLVDMGYTVAGSAASAEEAIRLASSAGPTLILMDIMLQGIMDGTDAAKIISRHLQIPIVFVTAYSDIKTVERAAGSAPYGFLTKPFQPRELRAAIEVALYKSQMERHLRDSERWFATALRCVGDAVIATNANAEITFLNPVAEQLVGWTLDEARGHRIDEVMRLDAPFGEHGLIANPIFTALRDNEVIATKYGAQLVRRDGSMIPIDDSAAPIRDDDNAVLGAVLVARDVSLRLKQEADLRASEERFRSTFEHAASGMALVALDGRFLMVNQSFGELLGYRIDELRALKHTEVTVEDDRQQEQAALFEIMSGVKPAVQIEKRYRHREAKRVVWTLASISALRETENPICFLYQVYDVTERKNAEYKLAIMAYYDPLTGLGNRSRLRDEFQRIIAHARRQHSRVAVCLMDLDRFKQVNDTLGHEVGDELLIEVAARLRATLRETDSVARLGGDEFVLILSEVDSIARLHAVLEKLRLAISAPVTLAGRTIVVTPTIGVALYPIDGGDMQVLLRNADSALYAAKADGRNRYRLFQIELEQEAGERLTIESDLRQALSQNEFELYLQPLIRLKDQSIVGCEALLRWRHDGELVMPSRFLPIAEDTGLILPIGTWVVAEACRAASAWTIPISISINCSPRQFRENAVAPSAAAALASSGLAPERLCLEITEVALGHNNVALNESLAMLRASGVRLAIDDYGTGYSSLAYLKRFAPQSLKIDAFFIRDLLTDETSAEIVAATVAMAHKLGIEVVAEGVELEEQAHHLAELGCDYAQGYYFGRPIASAQFSDMLASRQ